MTDTTNVSKKLQQEVAKLRMLINTHIGNPNAHSTVKSPYDPKGFIDGKTWRFANKNPRYISANSDILQLDSGLYVTSDNGSLLNAPETGGGLCYIEVFKQSASENANYALIKFYNVALQRIYYGWKATGSNGIIWDRSNEKRDLGGNFSGTNSYFTVINTMQSTLIYVHIDIDVNIAENSAVTLSTGFPGSLRPTEAIHFGADGTETDNSWGSAGLIFQTTGSISVVNKSVNAIKHVNGTMIYQLHTETSTAKWGEQ